MGSVISESQSAFIRGRQILDVVIITIELVDDVRQQKKRRYYLKLNLRRL